MYKVIYKFADVEDGLHVYDIGDVYPREGIEASGRRIAELATCNNKIGRVLIKEVKSEPKKSSKKQ